VAAWFVGKGFGILMSILSVGIWAAGDLAAGAQYSSPWIMVWNALILMTVYFIVVGLLTSLRSVHLSLEARVEQRTAALTAEIAARERLEGELLKVSEREQRHFGHELHDSVCQHLTATALAGQVLTEELAAKALPQAADAERVVEMFEQGITLARNLAHGLYPVEMQAEGLMAAFQELAETIAKTARVSCAFECDQPVLIGDNAAATHLYRIGQEAVRNALQHGKPNRIGIHLSERDGVLKLTVEDDGVGLPDDWQKSEGIGVRIMAHRSTMISGKFTMEPAPTGGTIVTCESVRPPAKSNLA
jgi:signal transduction histidine kinase